MTDKIILDIRHSDPYTDSLFLTAAFTNRRVMPLVDPDRDEIRRRSGVNTAVIRCVNTREECAGGGDPVFINGRGDLFVRSRCYLADDGSIDFGKAEAVRALIGNFVTDKLLAPANLLEVYRQNFHVLWACRSRIYADPQLFYARSGRYSSRLHDCLPIGTILRAIEDDPANFRLSLRGGCSCSESPILVDYPSRYSLGNGWRLFTWCPKCGSRREVQAGSFWRRESCDLSFERTDIYYNKGRGYSALSLLDVVDRLRST